MRVMVIDDDGRPLINTTIDIASERPEPAYSFRESKCALVDVDPSSDPKYFLSKLQIVLSYLGTACLSRLVNRLNSLCRDSRYHRNIMEEQAIASELSQALLHVNNAYQRVLPYSTPGANALAKVSNDLGSVYTRIRDGSTNDAFGKLSIDLAPHVTLESAETPQPDGLNNTFFRQRPKETWLATLLRVISEDGFYSLSELRDTNITAAAKAATEIIRIKRACESLDIKFLQTVAGIHTEPKPINPPRTSGLSALIASRDRGHCNGFDASNGLYSPLRGEATPFTPTGSSTRPSIFAALDDKNAFGGSDSSGSSGQSSTSQHGGTGESSRFRYGGTGRGILPGVPLGGGVYNPHNAFGSPITPSFQLPRQSPLPLLKTATFGAIGHERAKSSQLKATPPSPEIPPEVSSLDELPEHWEDVVADDESSETACTPVTQQYSNGDVDEIVTPRPGKERNVSPLFEVNGPDSPTYRTWAQKAAVGDDDSGWEQVAKGKKAGHPPAIKQPVAATSISHKAAYYVIISGCRAGTTLSEITSQIDTGPLVSVALEKSPSDGSVTARVLFVFGSNAIEFIGNDQYSRQRHGESVYGPGVSVNLGGGYTGNPADLRGMSVPLNQAGRSDAGAHFERRRITFSGNGLAMTEAKLRNTFVKVADVPASEIETIIVFNPGNATVIFASVFSARRVKEVLGAKKSGEWKSCKIMYSSDPCERHLSFMDKMKREAQANRAAVVRRAYQKAGKVNC